MLNTTSITPSKLAQLLPTLHSLKLPCMLWGDPGVGKSAIIKEFARQNNLRLYDLRLTQMDAQDLKGLPYIDERTQRTVNYLPEFLPKVGEVEEQGYSGSIIFLDEIVSAEQRLMASAYQLILDRAVGTEYTLPDSCWVLCAGNPIESNAISYEMGSALSNRLCHYKVVCEPGQWLNWATSNNIASQVMTFIKVKPDYLYGGQGALSTNNSSENLIFPSPRGWEKVSNVINFTQDRDQLDYIISGIVGKAACAEFFHVVEEVDSLPPIPDLLAAEGKALIKMLPTKTSAMYGLAYSISSYCNDITTFKAALRIFNTFAEIEDDKPRDEIQALAMELLFEKIYARKDPSIIVQLGRSSEYLAYRKKAKQMLSLYEDENEDEVVS